MSLHQAVMLEEVIEHLDVHAGGLYIDGTFGGGTHTEALLCGCAPEGRVLSLDVNRKALEDGKIRLASYGDRWIGLEANFRHIEEEAKRISFAPVDGILLDLGFSSDELQDPTIGLSFMKDGPLDMRLGEKSNEDGLTAADIINTWSEADLTKMLTNFGEERFASRIAQAILRTRKASRIIRTLDLVTIIERAVPATYEHGRIHPATRTFQALRIAVNDELEALKDAIRGARALLKQNGRLAIITFHSLEDRIVKQAIQGAEDMAPLTKKPLVPSEEEVRENPRARSAKLRVAIKK